jgi:hypothetical protein
MTDKNIANLIYNSDWKEIVMLAWCSILFLLGVVAVLDSTFNYGELLRRVNSLLFMLVSLGLLVRTAIKVRKANRALRSGDKAAAEMRLDVETEREATPTSTV